MNRRFERSARSERTAWFAWPAQYAYRIGRYLDRFEAEDLVPHPLKRFSRRFLSAGVWFAAFLHFFVAGGVYVYSQIDFEPMVELKILPYPDHLIDLVDPARLLTSERGGGRPGRLEPPEDPGDDIMSQGVPVPVVVGIPEPIDDSLIAEEHEIATQEEMERAVAVAMDTESEPATRRAWQDRASREVSWEVAEAAVRAVSAKGATAPGNTTRHPYRAAST